MHIGKLRHKVAIEEYVGTRDSFGAEIPEWVQVASVWASVIPISGKEYIAFKQVNSEISTKVIIRYRSGVTTNMRLIYKNRIFEIDSIINPDEKNICLVLMCKEAV